MKWTAYHIELALKHKADLREADLCEAGLRGADLCEADLRRADLRGADLGGADLGGAYLGGADLSGANLSGADLRGADLRGADLDGADLTEAALSPFQIVPETGSFIAYKKLRYGQICTIRIPAEAKRTSSLVGRKCRAEYVEVLEGEGQASYDDTVYAEGKIVKADKWDDDIRIECTHGIHFFMTKQEVIEYV